MKNKTILSFLIILPLVFGLINLTGHKAYAGGESPEAIRAQEEQPSSTPAVLGAENYNGSSTTGTSSSATSSYNTPEILLIFIILVIIVISLWMKSKRKEIVS